VRASVCRVGGKPGYEAADLERAANLLQRTIQMLGGSRESPTSGGEPPISWFLPVFPSFLELRTVAHSRCACTEPAATRYSPDTQEGVLKGGGGRVACQAGFCQRELPILLQAPSMYTQLSR
jgi:hypothetical protein